MKILCHSVFFHSRVSVTKPNDFTLCTQVILPPPPSFLPPDTFPKIKVIVLETYYCKLPAGQAYSCTCNTALSTCISMYICVCTCIFLCVVCMCIGKCIMVLHPSVRCPLQIYVRRKCRILQLRQQLAPTQPTAGNKNKK